MVSRMMVTGRVSLLLVSSLQVFLLLLSHGTFAVNGCDEVTKLIAGSAKATKVDAREHPVRRLLMVGTGDVVRKFYLPALVEQKRLHPDLQVVFVDDSTYWSNDPVLVIKMKSIYEEIVKEGFKVLDTAPQHFVDSEKILQEYAPDAVIIATPDKSHEALSLKWLKATKNSSSLVPIIVEKPFSTDAKSANRMLTASASDGDRILALDHYSMMTQLDDTQWAQAMEHLGGQITRIEFLAIEDRSGGHLGHHTGIDADGPVEREGRLRSLQNGLSADMLAHMPPSIAQAVDTRTLKLKEALGGIYTVSSKGKEVETALGAETFSATTFTAKLRASDDSVEIRSYVGKGIRGIRSFMGQHDGNVKITRYVGRNNKEIWIEMDATKKDPLAHYVDSGKVVSSFPIESGYRKLAASLMSGTYLQSGLLDESHVGVTTVQAIDATREQIRKNSLIKYPTGMRKTDSADGRQALYLEDVLKLFGRSYP